MKYRRYRPYLLSFAQDKAVLVRYLIIVSMAFAFLFSSPLRAEYYYWSYDLNKKFASAGDAANGVLQMFSDEDSNYYNYSIVGMSEVWAGDDNNLEVYLIGYYFGVQRSNFSYRITRRGWGCPDGAEYDRDLRMCPGGITAAQKGNRPLGLSCDTPSPYKSDPINIAIGNEYQEIVDLKISNSPINLTRFYNSVDGIWRHSYSDHLSVAAASARLVLSDGREIIFAIESGDVFRGPVGQGRLVKNATSWTYFSPSNDQVTFDTTGRLSEKRSAIGVKQRVANLDNVLTITDDFGNSLVVKQDAYYQLNYFNYGSTSASYTYNASGRLINFSSTAQGESKEVNYSYADARNTNLLTSVIDERGVSFAMWTYDDQGRATSSTHAGNVDRTTIAYNADGSATVINPLGKITNYQFQTIQGMKRITAIHGEPSPNCPNSNSTFTYDEHGLLATKTDAKGFITTHEYNDRGLETSRTEAAGTPQARTTTTTWHATFNLPLTVTEPGQQTTYTYDAQGRQTSRVQTAL